MLSQKPEFIDPEEGNLNYYYDRNKKENELAKNQGCCKKKHFLVFHEPKKRVYLIVFYLLVVGALFFFSHQKLQKQKSPQLKNISASLSGFYTSSQKTYYLQILFKNDRKVSANIHILECHIILFDKKNIVQAEKTIKNQTFTIKEKGIYTLKTNILTVQKPYKIKIILKDSNNKESVSSKTVF